MEFVARMSSTLGRSGRIIEVDMSQIDRPLLQLEFYDSESLQLSRWWYTLKALCSPPTTDNDVLLQQQEEEEEGEEEGEEEEGEEEGGEEKGSGGEKDATTTTTATPTTATTTTTTPATETPGASCEVALARMYAQRLLLESWSQRRERASTVEEKDALVLDPHFFALAINDCFGPLHTTAARSAENSG